MGRLEISAAGTGVILAPCLLSCSLLIDPVSFACDSDEDCALSGFSCVDGMCVEAAACSDASDCARAGLSGFDCVGGVCLDPRWSCLGWVPPPVGDTTEPVLRQRFVEITTQMPPPDLSVTLCQNPDIECRRPVARALTPRPNGVVTATVPNGFEGFADVRSQRISPSLVHFSRPIVEDIQESEVLSLQLLPLDFVVSIANQLGLPVDQSRAILLIGSRDCAGQRAAGTVVSTAEMDASTLLFYVDGDLPVPSADRTFASGNTVILNHPAGSTTVHIERASTGERIGTRTIFVRAGFFNYLELPPTPLP